MNELSLQGNNFFNLVEEIEDYAILFLSTQGVIESWNKGAEKIKGYKASEIIGRDFHVFYTAEDQANQLPETLIRRAAETGRARHEGWRVRKDGSLFWGNITLSALHNEKRELTGFMKITRDLTDTMLAQKAAMAEKHNEYLQAKNTELEHFTYIASHDLQEPLNSITSLARVLDETYSNALDEKGRTCIRYILESSLRMSTRIRGLLDYSRLGKTREMREVNCMQIADETVSDLSQRLIKSSCSVHIGKLPVIIAYESELKILFLNLLSNAIKFRRSNVKSEIYLTAERKEQCWQFSVRDNGIGIPAGQEERVFQIFQRLNSNRDFEGDGIGLSLCHKAVELHGGKIWVEQVPGGGCNFIFTIPDPTDYEKT